MIRETIEVDRCWCGAFVGRSGVCRKCGSDHRMSPKEALVVVLVLVTLFAGVILGVYKAVRYEQRLEAEHIERVRESAGAYQGEP